MSNPTTREKLREEWNDFVEENHRNNPNIFIPSGVADWWLDKLESELTLREKETVARIKGYFERWRRNKSRKFESAVEQKASEEAIRMFVECIKEYENAKERISRPPTSEDKGNQDEN